LSLSLPSREKKLGKKKVKKKKHSLANGFQRAARLVLVLSADVHVGRHVRRRGHVLCFCYVNMRERDKRWSASVTFSEKRKGPKSRHSLSQKNDDDDDWLKQREQHTHLVVIVDVAHVALGLDAIVAVREYQRGLRREEDDEDE
jgi:hypothetical protein